MFDYECKFRGGQYNKSVGDNRYNERPMGRIRRHGIRCHYGCDSVRHNHVLYLVHHTPSVRQKVAQ